ncbi:MAG: hypothetical protein VCE91_12005 [Nitrospinota bacterium]
MAEVGVVRDVDTEKLRQAVQREYTEVANHPDKGFHFHTGRPLAKILGSEDEWMEAIPESAIESLAGTGNPFRRGEIDAGEHVVVWVAGRGWTASSPRISLAPRGASSAWT